ncbi:MAG: tetratricopeptide repeat protein [Candidatus Sericytochromatia bacterium]|nr:tetratricopeptide repeat protein [Candidatus Tanganyikabacteria bacterium]
MTSTTCPACGGALAPFAKFCSNCGSQVALACPTCQGAVEAEQKFCIHCGGALPTGSDGPEQAAGDPAAPADAAAGAQAPAIRRTMSAPLGDRRIVTVLFADVQGLEGLQQSLDPEEVTDITNALFKQLSDLIYKYGGTIDKYLSDGLMALFGAPTAHEDDPERAVMAAYELIEKARVLTDKLVARTGVRLSLRCGLHTGLVVAGEVGGDAKKDYTVMGDTVNLAQRVKANAKADQVLVTVETFRLTQMLFSYNALPPIQVKGREELVHPYELIGPREEEGSGGRERTNLVGRREELSRLHQCLEAASGGRPQLVNVVGEAGIGKSRMVREFVHYFTTYGVGLLLKGRGLSYQQETSYAVVGSMLAQYMGISPGTSSHDIGEEARNVAETYWPQDAGRRAALLAHLMGAEILHPEVTHLSPQQKRIAAFLAFNELLVAMAKRYTVLVSIEDLHWADEASVEWIASLVDYLAANAHEAIALLILCQYRPREDARFVRFGGKIDLTKVFLNPLPQQDARQLFGALVGIGLEPDAWPADIRGVADAVLTRAEGNPLFLTALVMSITDQGILAKKDNQWVLAKPIGELQLPDTISRVVTSRLDRLPDDLKSLISAAAVIGRSFHPRVLSQVLGGSEVDQGLEQLVKMTLIHRKQNGEFAFDHSTTQEVAYQSLLQATRREMHRRVGAALEQLLGDQWEPSSGILARHFYQGGDPARAVRYLAVAGEQSRRRFANKEALVSFRHALRLAADPAAQAVVDRRKLLRSLAEVETVMGDFPSAFEHLEEALRLTLEDEPRAELHRLAGEVLERKGELKAALKRYREATSLLAGASSPAAPNSSARLLLATAGLLMTQGEIGEARGLAREALGRLSGSRTRELAQAHELLGSAHFAQSEWDEALGEHATALGVREELQDLFGIASSKSAMGNVYVVLGDWHRAASLLEEAMQLYTRAGDLLHLGEAQAHLGDIYAAFGEISTAERLQRAALDIFRRIGGTLGEGRALIALGNTSAAAERFEEALAYLKDGLQIFEEIAAVEQQADAYAAMARVALAAGREDEGLGHMQRALKVAEATQNRLALAVVNRLKAELLVADGFKDGAHAAIEKAVGLLGALNSPLELGRAKLTQAKVERLRGDEGSANRLFKEAVATFAKLGAKPDLRLAEDLAGTFAL